MSKLEKDRKSLVRIGRRVLLGGLAVVSIGSVWNQTTRVQGQASKIPEPRQVLASEIGQSVQIIGSLGKPIGELVTIRGHWRRPDSGVIKGDDAEFEISSVNGVLLDKPCVMGRYFVEHLRGLFDSVPEPVFHSSSPGSWELRGYESGGFEQLPEGALAEYSRGNKHGIALQRPSEAPSKFGFYCKFLIITARKVDIIGK